MTPNQLRDLRRYHRKPNAPARKVAWALSQIAAKMARPKVCRRCGASYQAEDATRFTRKCPECEAATRVPAKPHKDGGACQCGRCENPVRVSYALAMRERRKVLASRTENA